MKILFIGDVVGKIGRRTVAHFLPKIKKKYKPDLVIANAENSAHGTGITPSSLNDLIEAGVDTFTGGDHSFDKPKQFDCYDNFSVIRPANYANKVPGQGYRILDIKGRKILLVNLIGRVFMRGNYNCPFAEIENILSKFSKDIDFAIIDIHAEATAEKISLFRFLDGKKVSAIFGTHTHVMTADAQISENGTAYITDTGMVGYADGSIGVEEENILKTILTQINYPHVIPEKGRVIFSAVLLELDEKNHRAKSLKTILEYSKIK